MASTGYQTLATEELRSSKDRQKYKLGAILALTVVAIIIIIIVVSVDKSNDSSGGNTDPFVSLKGYCSNIAPISLNEWESRRSCMSQQLTANDLDVYVTEPGGSMLYFSGVQWGLSERAFLLVIMRNGSVAFLAPEFEEARALEYTSAIAPLYTWEEDQDPFEVLFTEILGSPATLKLAIDPYTRTFIPDGISKVSGFSGSIINGNEVVRSCRMIKSSAEINIMRCANQATKAVLRIVQNELYEGMYEAEVSSKVLTGLGVAGLTPSFAIALFAANAAYPHGTTNKLQLQKGNLVLIDAGGILYGYRSDITRTFPFYSSALTSEQINVWNVVKEAQNASLAKINIGVPCSAIDAAARNVTAANGYGANYEYFTHRLGHGIGYDGHEEPYMVRGNDNLTLQAGMTFSVEPGIYIPGDLGVRIEDIVVVTNAPPYFEVFGSLSESIYNPIPP